MLSLIFITLGFAAQEPERLVGSKLIAPPSQYEALTAVHTEVAERAARSYYGALGRDFTQSSNYPIDVHLVRCDKTLSRALLGPSGERIVENGFDCVMDIYPIAEPHFRTYGFFYHTGLEWRYYGALGAGLLIDIDRYDTSPIESQQTARDGSVLYDGQPFGKKNLQNPYKSIIDGYNASFNFYTGREEEPVR
ncbi:MAG: hypothetical protein AAGJ73_02700 [Pseudomonadota bacterium]